MKLLQIIGTILPSQEQQTNININRDWSNCSKIISFKYRASWHSIKTQALHCSYTIAKAAGIIYLLVQSKSIWSIQKHFHNIVSLSFQAPSENLDCQPEPVKRKQRIWWAFNMMMVAHFKAKLDKEHRPYKDYLYRIFSH